MKSLLPMQKQTGNPDKRGERVVKLVVSDMDGTLIDKDEILPEKAVKIAAALKKKGILFTIATGRTESMVSEYVKALDIEIPYIACNGVTIINKGKVLLRNKIPLKGLRLIIQQAELMDMSLVYSVDGIERVYKTTPWIEYQRKMFDRYHEECQFTEADWERLYIDKLMIMDAERQGAIAVLEAMCKQLPDAYGFTRYTNKSVEIVDRNSTKASALHEVLRILGVDQKEVLAIGDHRNDMEMLSMAGIGAVVANAIDEVKAKADYIARRSCIDGVQEVVEKFCRIVLE